MDVNATARERARMTILPGASRYPRLPVLGWSTFAGRRRSPLPAVWDAPACRYTQSGRAAIAAALRLLGTAPGERVLVPTYHCPSMVAPVAEAGAQPLFYPIDAQGVPQLEWVARADLAGARAMLVAHYFGFAQPMARLRAFCDAHGLALIEDCAHALFGTADGRPVGGWGDFAIASLTKFLPAPEGGLLASATRSLDGVKLARRSCYDELKAAADALETAAAHDRLAGCNAALRALFAAKRSVRGRAPGGLPAGGELHSGNHQILRSALAARFIAGAASRHRIVDRRRSNYARLAERLAGVPGARPLRPRLDDAVAPYVFPLWVDRPAAPYARMREAGIPVFRWDERWPDTPGIAGDAGGGWAQHVLQLGCHQDLAQTDIDAIAQAMRAILRT